VRAVPFDRRWVLGVTDAGGTSSVLRRLRLFGRLRGVNLLADLPGSATGPRVLLVAHLDSVAAGPGADDNASGVAVLLECARLLASLPAPPRVQLAVVDMEELGRVGSTALAAREDFVRGIEVVICLESVGVFSDEPGSQRLGGLGLVFRELAAHVRANGSRGDFLLALHRRSSSASANAIAVAAQAMAPPLPVEPALDPRSDGWRGRLLTLALLPLATLDRSDHAPFWNRGTPAIMLTTTALFRNRHYHLAGDSIDKLDYRRLSALAPVVAAVASTALVAPAVPERRAPDGTNASGDVS
jgi:Zn-dependent M28 family amino/carboxypeptidase